jgi:hypothetical protein
MHVCSSADCGVSSADLEEDEDNPGVYYCASCWDKFEQDDIAASDNTAPAAVEAAPVMHVCSSADCGVSSADLEEDEDNPGVYYCSSCWDKFEQGE